MAHLTQLWNDKLKNIRQQGRLNINEHDIEKRYRVAWDDPNFGQGEKVHEEHYATHPEALDYAIGIGLKYDLRKRNGKFHQVDPEQSRFKSGFSELPDISAIPAVWPTIVCYGHMPQSVEEDEVIRYCIKHNITDRPEWTLPVKERLEQKIHNAPERRTKAGPL